MKTAYEIGDDAWIYLPHHNGERAKGTVVHKFSLPGWAVSEHYVVEVQTEVDPLLFVREPFTMSPSENQDIGIWEELRRDKGSP